MSIVQTSLTSPLSIVGSGDGRSWDTVASISVPQNRFQASEDIQNSKILLNHVPTLIPHTSQMKSSTSSQSFNRYAPNCTVCAWLGSSLPNRTSKQTSPTIYLWRMSEVLAMGRQATRRPWHKLVANSSKPATLSCGELVCPGISMINTPSSYLVSIWSVLCISDIVDPVTSSLKRLAKTSTLQCAQELFQQLLKTASGWKNKVLSVGDSNTDLRPDKVAQDDLLTNVQDDMFNDMTASQIVGWLSLASGGIAICGDTAGFCHIWGLPSNLHRELETEILPVLSIMEARPLRSFQACNEDDPLRAIVACIWLGVVTDSIPNPAYGAEDRGGNFWLPGVRASSLQWQLYKYRFSPLFVTMSAGGKLAIWAMCNPNMSVSRLGIQKVATIDVIPLLRAHSAIDYGTANISSMVWDRTYTGVNLAAPTGEGSRRALSSNAVGAGLAMIVGLSDGTVTKVDIFRGLGDDEAGGVILWVSSSSHMKGFSIDRILLHPANRSCIVGYRKSKRKVPNLSDPEGQCVGMSVLNLTGGFVEYNSRFPKSLISESNMLLYCRPLVFDVTANAVLTCTGWSNGSTLKEQLQAWSASDGACVATSRKLADSVGKNEVMVVDAACLMDNISPAAWPIEDAFSQPTSRPSWSSPALKYSVILDSQGHIYVFCRRGVAGSKFNPYDRAGGRRGRRLASNLSSRLKLGKSKTSVTTPPVDKISSRINRYVENTAIPTATCASQSASSSTTNMQDSVAVSNVSMSRTVSQKHSESYNNLNEDKLNSTKIHDSASSMQVPHRREQPDPHTEALVANSSPKHSLTASSDTAVPCSENNTIKSSDASAESTSNIRTEKASTNAASPSTDTFSTISASTMTDPRSTISTTSSVDSRTKSNEDSNVPISRGLQRLQALHGSNNRRRPRRLMGSTKGRLDPQAQALLKEAYYGST